MTAAIAFATVLMSIGGFLDFIVGEKGNKHIKDRLVDFYIIVEDGDWTMLYKVPARSLLRYIYYLFGNRIFSFKFVLICSLVSAVLTLSMVFLVVFLVYMQSIWNSSDTCLAPPLELALGVPFFISGILAETIIINAIFDLMTWSTTIFFLINLERKGSHTAMFSILFVALFTILVLHTIQSLYIPIALAQNMRNYNISFDINEYIRFFYNNFKEIRSGYISIQPFVAIICYPPSVRPFQISFIGLTQYAALESLIPMIVFVLTTLAGTALYISRSLTRGAVSLFVSRLAETKNIFLTLSALLSGLIAILKVLSDSK